MTEPAEAPQGQPGAVAQPTDVMSAPSPEPAQPEAKEGESPSKYGGKSVEDLLRELEEKDRYVSEVNERAARAEHEALLTRNLVEQFARERGKPQEQTEQAPELQISDDDFLTKPGDTFRKGFQWMQAQFRAERERDKAEQYITQARTAFEEGKAAALKADPLLFKGIEQTVADNMFAMVKMSLDNKQPIDPTVLRDPKTWRGFAAAKRINDGEDLAKYVVKSHTPMAPVHQETPTPGAPPQGRPPLTDEAKMGARFFEVSEDQWAAADQALKEKK